MEEKINFKEFLLKQYDDMLGSKDRLESKIASYLTTEALILATAVSYIAILKEAKCLKNFLFLDGIVVFIGLFNLLVCIITLMPKLFSAFDSTSLYLSYIDKEEIDDKLLSINEAIIYKNKKVINSMRIGYIVVSIGLICQIIAFIFVSIVFFEILSGV
ncbi:hypothetical protein [Treponema sp.]|uniref:hypothetical protein n=1 Tax=Treponema sp. TaxID=166 RepID=UPI003EFE8238